MALPNGARLAWPSTAASIPAGFSRDTALDARVPLPASASIGTNGGSDTHTHTTASHQHNDNHGHVSGGLATGGAQGTTGSANTRAGNAHNHSGFTPTVAVASGLTMGSNAGGASSSGASTGFARYSVIFVTSNGTTDIPTGMMVWSSLSAGVPANFTAHAASINSYLRGAAAAADGGTATAAASHNHTYSHQHAHSATAHTHPFSGTTGAGNDADVLADAGTNVLSLNSHIHTFSGASSSVTHNTNNATADNATADNQTPDLSYHKLQHITANSAQPAVPGIIVMWPNTTPPTGWAACNGANGTPNINGSGRYIKGANGSGEIGNTGGSNNHNHSGSHSHPVNTTATNNHTKASGAGGGGQTGVSGGATQGVDGHTHTSTTGNRNGTTSTDAVSYPDVDWQPANRTMFFIMLLPAVLVTLAPVTMPTVVRTPSFTKSAVSFSTQPVVTSLSVIPIFGLIPPPPVVEPPEGAFVPTDEQVADALGGCRHPVALRYRFEWWYSTLEPVMDISSAIEGASISLVNSRAITRTCRMTVRPENLPADFDVDFSLVACFAELNVEGHWVRFPLGVFLLDYIVERLMPNGQERWEAQGVDLISRLVENEVSQPYTIAAGTNYATEAARICQLLGLGTNISSTPHVTPVDFVWPAGTSYWAIVNDLMNGVNFYPLWAQPDGLIASRRRIDPSLEPAAVLYTTEEAPRMIRPDLRRVHERGRFTNRAIVAVTTTGRAPASVQVTNDDTDSPVSTLNKRAVTSQNINGDKVASIALMGELGASIVRDGAVKSQTAGLTTHPDPRRDAHEFYTVKVDNREDETHWRVEEWSYDCRNGAAMSHLLGRAAHVDVTTSVIVETVAGVTTTTPPPPDPPPGPPPGGWPPEGPRGG